jgi:hypothetical protein
LPPTERPSPKVENQIGYSQGRVTVRQTVDFVINGQRVYTADGFRPLAVAVHYEKTVPITGLKNALAGLEMYVTGDGSRAYFANPGNIV